MAKRIAIVGAESTGKTALAQALARRFHEPWSREYVRDLWYARNGDIRAADLPTIARGQIDNEDRAARRARRLVICDTDLWLHVCYADWLFPGQCPDWVRYAARRRGRRFSLYLLCATDLAFESDPQRCLTQPGMRDAFQASLQRRLTRERLPFVTVDGRGAIREQRAVRALTHGVSSLAPR
ncbi:AAA family ATPase [Salinisphaera orenii]|uniref:AAA family ATPase n=1 Tax=Salinisphaera orenii TaxID=856731 RepID=UPI0013A6676E